VAAAPGTAVFAGTLNLGEVLTVRATATAGNTLLAECVRLIEAAEARIRRLKKRAERRQDWLGRKMADLGLSASQERPLFTLGLEWKSHVVVTDETTLAPRYIKHSPDKIAIAKDLRSGTFVGEGAEMSNPQPSARIYRK